MKKSCIALISLSLCLTLSYSVMAGLTELVRWSSNTYVTSYHPDYYLADTYTGTLSVRGADTKQEGTVYYYPKYVQITYDVQGKIERYTQHSKGSADKETRVKTVTVKDPWNLNPVKTKVYGLIGREQVTGATITSNPGNDSFQSVPQQEDED